MCPSVQASCAPGSSEISWEGVSHTALLIDLGVDHEIVEKSGSWFSYGDLRMGQGKENSKIFLVENPDIAEEIELRLRTALGLDDANQEELEEADDLVSEMLEGEVVG